MSSPIHLEALPFTLSPSEGSAWELADGAVTAVAAPHTDLFVDPVTTAVNSETMLNAHRLLGPAPAEDFQFSARVEADLTAQFDAAVLLLWLDENHWAKLCYELSPDGDRMVVSVVNREVCDDANGFVADGTDVWLRISRVGSAFAFHASRDGRRWEFVRVFSLEATDGVQLGFSAQSPTGEGCAVRFTDVAFASQSLANLRDGS